MNEFKKNILKPKYLKRIIKRNIPLNNNKIICAKVFFNMNQFILDDTRIQFEFKEIFKPKDATSFYLIIDSSMQIFETSNEVYVFSDSEKNIGYKIKKEENEGNTKIFHIFYILDKEIKFELNSLCSQNIHSFFNFQLIKGEIVFSLSTRFTSDPDKIIKQTISAKWNQEIIKNNNLNQVLVFNKKIIKVINTFKNFNFSFLEEITLIYKINHILEFSKKINYQNIMINNILSDEFVNNNNFLYDYESDAFDLEKNFMKNIHDEMHKIKSVYLSYDNCVCPIENCLNCNQEKNICLKCKENKIIFKNTCIDKCPQGTYFDNKDGKCLSKMIY
jgi:hypothetical protein